MAGITGLALSFPGRFAGRGNSMSIFFITIALFYTAIGYIVQCSLKKSNKNEKFVFYMFVALAFILIIAVVIEAMVRGGLTA